MALMIRCILYPGIHLFVTSGGKEQGASILSSKVKELCKLIPALNREIDWTRGKTLEGKDYVKYIFKNGSVLDNLAAKETTRGQRRHGGLMEECVGIDDAVLREVIIPVMAIPRRAADGSINEFEPANKSQIYITTAGFKNTYPYDRLIGLLVRMVTQPDRCMVLGGTWRTPVAVGLQQKTFITDQKQEGTYNEASFAREYESVWSGTSEDAFFRADLFDKQRILKLPEYESTRVGKNCYYIISADIGRKGCDSVAVIYKVSVLGTGVSVKHLVNIETRSDEHFEYQAIWLKQLYYKYQARRLVIDGNGMGIGLIDYMVMPQTVKETLEVLPPFGIYNDEEGYYKKFRTDNTEENAIYIIKANAPINTEAHANAQSQIASGRVKFLEDERLAKNKLMGTAKGKNMSSEQRAEYLKPYTLTSILREEMCNLKEENEGVNIILKCSNKNIHKDKFSAMEYGLYYIKNEEDNKKARRKFNAKEWTLMN